MLVLIYLRASSKGSDIRALAAHSYISGIRKDSGYKDGLYFPLDNRFKTDHLRISAKYENHVHHLFRK